MRCPRLFIYVRDTRMVLRNRCCAFGIIELSRNNHTKRSFLCQFQFYNRTRTDRNFLMQNHQNIPEPRYWLLNNHLFPAFADTVFCRKSSGRHFFLFYSGHASEIRHRHKHSALENAGAFRLFGLGRVACSVIGNAYLYLCGCLLRGNGYNAAV